MRPLLVVEDERLVRGGAETEAASRNIDVVQTIPGIDGRIRGGGILEGKNGARMAEGLEDDREVLRVHALVQRGERVEIHVLFPRFPPVEAAGASAENLGDVLEGRAPGRVVVLPAPAVGHVKES